MKVNIIANHMRTQRGEPLTVQMLLAELEEVKTLKPRTLSVKVHIAALEAMIIHKSKHTA